MRAYVRACVHACVRVFRFVLSENTPPLRDPDQFERSTRVENDEFDCSRRRDGVYGGGCRAFYRCLDHRGSRVQCRRTYVFNKHTGHCGRSDNTSLYAAVIGRIFAT